MSNNFSGDSNCKALWNMESGALTTDSKGSNTLTDNNTVGESTGDFKQGACAADLEYDNYEYFSITDANLDSGFPLKSGDTNKIFSLCTWFKPESVGYLCYLASKYDVTTPERTIAIQVNADRTLGLTIGYNGGASYEGVTTTATVSAGVWYHLGITFDDSDGSYRIRLWDDTAGSVIENKTGNFYNGIYVGGADFVIGNRHDSSNSRNFDGLIDEMVVFSDVLSADEIDSVRTGYYGVSQEQPSGALSFSGSLSYSTTAVPERGIVKQISAPKSIDPREVRRFYEQVSALNSYQVYPGNPTSNLLPRWIGDRCLDTTNNDWYLAYGTSATDWKLL